MTATLDKFVAAKTDSQPHIFLDAKNNVFEIVGFSMPANGKAFYDPVINWIEAYAANPNKETIFSFDLEEFSIYSAKMILFILYSLKKIQDNGNQVQVNWYYDEVDDEMYESGKDYEIMVKIPFKFIKGVKTLA